jgi:hypothetical protein
VASPLTAYQMLVQKDVEKVSFLPGSHFLEVPIILVGTIVL